MESQDIEANTHFHSEKEYTAFTEITKDGVRVGFIRKVYMVIVAMLFFTLAFTEMAIHTTFGAWQINNLWALIVAAVFSIAICIILTCWREPATKVPTNYYLLAGFCLCESYIVSWSVVYYISQGAGLLVVWAALLTVAMTVGLSIFAFQTSIDITGWGAYLFVGCIGMIFLMIMGIIINIPWVTAAIAAAAIIFFGCYLVYDTQLLAGNKRQYFSEEDYIVAALNIYIDIIIIFLELIALLFAFKK